MIEGEHIVGDTNGGTRKRKTNTTTKERKNEIRYIKGVAGYIVFLLLIFFRFRYLFRFRLKSTEFCKYLCSQIKKN